LGPLDIILENPGPWLAWIVPIIGALLMPLFSKLGSRVRDYAAVAFALAAVISAASMIPYLFSGQYPGDVKITTWIEIPGGHPIEVGVLVDPLSIMISNVVAFIAFLIVVYSTGYMRGDPGLTRYWFFFLFFIGSMLLLVLSDNLLQLLIGWEGVGMCSYGLIGYYYRDDKERWLGGPPPTKMFPPSHAGMKAFVVTGIGDVFILAAIFIIFHYAGTLNFIELIEKAPEWLPAISAVPGLLSLTAVLFLGGPIGKSAQFPFHEWLPEAMAGPTSVSALIHAATMVKAGVYLVARMSPVFYIGAYSLHIDEAMIYFITIACVGAFTAFLAASQAMVALELKKVLAYSTVSQIGFMMMGLGISGLAEGAYVGGLTSGIFHLVSHALFKAALFLCAGSVIHAIESIYMPNMGGLKKYMPITHGLMLIATLSLAGIPPLSGFWSKDAVFVSALSAGTPLSLALLAVAAISAAMTFFYSIRYLSMTFYGAESPFIKGLLHRGHETHEPHGHTQPSHGNPEREEHEHDTSGHGSASHKAPSKHDDNSGHESKHGAVEHGGHTGVHEAPPVMWVPYAILVALVLAVSVLGVVGLFAPRYSPEVFIESRFEAMLEHMEVPVHLKHVEVSTKLTAVSVSAAMLLLGGVIGYLLYLARRVDSWALVSGSPVLKGIHTFLWNRWYMNAAYYAVFVDGLLSFKGWLFNGLEKMFFDKITPAVSGAFMGLSGAFFRGPEKLLFDRITPAVSGTFTRLGGLLFQDVERGVIDRGLNEGVPEAATFLYDHAKKLQTGVLSYNIIYIGLTFLILILVLSIWFGGL